MVDLAERLKDMSDYAGRLRYEELIAKMEETAITGDRELYVDSDKVLWDDIEKLKGEGLMATLLEGGDYSHSGCWCISW